VIAVRVLGQTDAVTAPVIPPVVTSEWLAQQNAGPLLLDVRWYLDGRSGRRAFADGHLPGARFVDLDEWLAGPADDTTGRHPLPDPAVFADGMRRLGVSDGSPVVAYDDAGGVIAARLVWMLRVTGHPAALLDGGLRAWTGPLETGPGADPGDEGSFAARPWPSDRLVGPADLAAPDAVLLDARDAERFRGDVEPVDARPGHIPGARNVPCRSNVTDDGRFLPPEVLRRRFESVGVRSGDEVVSYCGSGVTACHNLLALEHAGFRPGRLYPGSWSQYAGTELPAATGDGEPAA
jgi:thiosulfate/3-mercaptopyruvate sulfurtransferase